MKDVRSTIVDLSTVVVSICAVVVTVIALTSRRAVGTPNFFEPREIEDWQSYAESGHKMGSVQPILTIIEFGDYQCPACRHLYPVLDDLLDKYPDELQVVYRHWPLAQHQYAYPAAQAAECAAAQGRFEEYHRYLYTVDDWLNDAFVRFAEKSGIGDLEAFRACLGREGPIPAIDDDMAAASELDPFGTPTLIINGTLLGGVPSGPEIEQMILAQRR